MPYPDERAGLSAVQAIVGRRSIRGIPEQAGSPWHSSSTATSGIPTLSRWQRLVPTWWQSTAPKYTNHFQEDYQTPKSGQVSLGVVIITSSTLRLYPSCRKVVLWNPRKLRETEKGNSLGAMLPGTNAKTNDGLGSREWFRETFQNTLMRASLSGSETFADSLYHLLGSRHPVGNCPNEDCNGKQLTMPAPDAPYDCPSCGITIFTTDGLRIHGAVSSKASQLRNAIVV